MAPIPASSPLPGRILDAAEEVLRRHGAAKTNVVDVARLLGMSHANIYRHFASKKALLDAIAARWLHQMSDPLAIIVSNGQPATRRLAAWFDALRLGKRRKVLDDPELFRIYLQVTEQAREVVNEHVANLLSQLRRIIADGIASGEFSSALRPRAAARAFLQGTVQFHHPAMITQLPAPTDADARAVLNLLLAGLRHGSVRSGQIRMK